jgi:hypothetical protein
MISVSSRSQPAPIPKRPPAAEEIERRDLLGQQQRVPLGDQHDARGELDAARRPRGAGQGDERVDEVRVALRDHAVGRSLKAALRLHRDERMLGAPERFEAELLGLLRHEADVDQIGG